MSRYLADVFEIDDYISRGITKLFIISGVASGKSSWVKNVLSQKGSVLFVTSRKAKAEADKNDSSFSDIINWNTYDNQTLITNAKLASLIEKRTANGLQELNDFINHFDYIVIDEVHSIATDSLFAESCSTVLSFIEYAAELKKPIVCMTGTPAPIQFYFEENDWCILDYLKTCNYVKPERITMVMNHSVVSEIKNVIAGSSVVYFANRTNTITKKAKELMEKGIVKPYELAISVSKSRETEYFKDLENTFKDTNIRNAIIDASGKAYESIIKNKRLPNECKILFSTSTLKEGIDIENENMVLFCENHDISNLIQYFGRARKGKTKVFVVEDSANYPIESDELLYHYANQKETDAANQFLESEIHAEDELLTIKALYNLKTHVIKNPYIYYNVIKKKFQTFHIKFYEKRRLLSNVRWKHNIIDYCNSHKIDVFYPDLGRIMREVLEDIEKKGVIFYGDNIETLKRIIYTAYRISKNQPKKINEELERLNASIRVVHGTETKKEHRNERFWRIILADSFIEDMCKSC